MAGIPIVCAFDAPKTLVSTFNCGIECDPAHVDEVVQAIRKIRTMEADDRINMGINGKNAVIQNFTYERLAGKFASCF